MDPIDELLTRGVDKIYPSKEELEKILRSGKKLTLYQGFDPTGTQLHIGHMIGLMKLRAWQKLGHHIIFLIGDFTAMIGDPSGKYSTRKVLSHKETLENARAYKEQASRILKFDGENPAEVLFNGDWLGKISAIEFLKIAGLLSVQQVVERDMFQERQKKGEDIYMNEFLYPVMQAYDCVKMNVDLEVGGSDQTFNMLMGRKLMRHMLRKDKFVMSTILLTDTEGKKIGKTEGNVISITDEPTHLFGKIMSFPDSVIVKAFEALTFVPIEKIKRIQKDLKDGKNPILYKKQLAFEITKILNDETSAKKALEAFEYIIQKKELPTEIPPYVTNIPYRPELKVNVTNPPLLSSPTISDALVLSGMVPSRSEAKRVIEQGGVIYDGKTVTDPNEVFIPKDGAILQKGKHTFRKIKTE